MFSSRSSVLLGIEEWIRELCHRIKEFGLPPIIKVVLLLVFLGAVKENLKGIFGFDCPVVDYNFYGNIYIYGPSVVFFCIAVVISRSFCDFMTNCCRLSFKKRLLSSASSATDIYLGFSAPVLWIAFALLERDYYICAMYGPRLMRHWRMDPKNATEGTLEYEYVRARSQCQVIAWEIVIGWVLISTALVSFHRYYCREREKMQDGSIVV